MKSPAFAHEIGSTAQGAGLRESIDGPKQGGLSLRGALEAIGHSLALQYNVPIDLIVTTPTSSTRWHLCGLKRGPVLARAGHLILSEPAWLHVPRGRPCAWLPAATKL